MIIDKVLIMWNHFNDDHHIIMTITSDLTAAQQPVPHPGWTESCRGWRRDGDRDAPLALRCSDKWTSIILLLSYGKFVLYIQLMRITFWYINQQVINWSDIYYLNGPGMAGAVECSSKWTSTPKPSTGKWIKVSHISGQTDFIGEPGMNEPKGWTDWK